MIQTSNNARFLSGVGSPEGAVQGNPGDYYCNTSGGQGTAFYVKESGSGNTGWVSVLTTASQNAQFITVDGYTGLAVQATFGANVIKGNVIQWSQSLNDRAVPAIANADMPVGVAAANYSSGQVGWVIQSLFAWVKFITGVTPAKGYVIYVSGTAGEVDQSQDVPATSLHFRECGHVVKDGLVAGGLGLCTLHFN